METLTGWFLDAEVMRAFSKNITEGERLTLFEIDHKLNRKIPGDKILEGLMSCVERGWLTESKGVFQLTEAGCEAA